MRFRPTAAGLRSSTVSLESISDTYTSTLTGTGTVAASLIVTPDSLSFGSQATGTTSAAQTVTVTNVGGSAIQIGSASISGTDFGTASDQCSAATLLPGQDCTVGVTFSPSGTGPASGTLTIASDAPEGSHAVALSGTGVAPPTGTISLTPASHAFASQPVGTTSGAQTFTVAHTGGGPVALGAVTIAADGLLRGMLVSPGSFDFGVQATGVPSAAQEFVVVNTESAALLLGAISLGGPNAIDYLLVGESCGGATLLPSEQCSLGVVFLPTGTGPSVATVTISHNADGGSYAIGLAGNGGVAVDGGVVASAAATEFAVADNTCAGVTLGSGESCTFGVTFSPAAGDERAATLSVASDAGNGPHSVALSGIGQAVETPHLLFTPLLFNFGDQPTGSTATPQSITVTNTAGADVTISGVSLGGAAASSFSIKPGDDQCSGATLSVGKSCTVLVGFTPVATGHHNATLVFADDAPGGQRVIALTGNGVVPTAPAVGLSPTSHAFGNQQTGTTSAAQSFTLTNTGTAALHLGTLALGGASAQFALSADTCSNVELAPLGTCTFAVAFAPTTLGLQNATVTIPSDAASNPDTITLSGTGIAPPAPAISLSTASVSFGDQITGTTSAPQTVTVRNDGDASLVISTVTIGGANSAQFTLGTDSCTGASLDPDDTCTFEVSFAPTAIGPASATVGIASNAASSPDTASLSGTGTPVPAPDVTLSPTSLGFGNQQVGTTSGSQPVTLTNSGTAPLTIVVIAASGDFAQTNDCPATLQPDTTCTIGVTFSPTATGGRAGTLTITSDAASSPNTLTLDGTGTAPPTPAVSLSTTSLAFGVQQVGTTSATQSVTVTNTGDGTLNLGTPSLGATTQFAIVENGCLGASLGHNQSCTVAVAFTPTSSGFQSATLSIPSNAASSPDAVALAGTGTDPSFSLSPTALDFGTQPVGTTSAQQSVTVTNTGNGPVVPGAGVVAGPGFAIASDGCASATLTPLQTCSLALTFTATATGPASGTLTLGSQSVTLAGTGSSAPIATTLGVAPASGSYGGTVTLTATLRNSGNSAPLAGKTIDFAVGGASVGTATTDTSGTAILPAVALGTRAAGNYANAVRASFAGDDGALPSSGTANLTVTRALLTITADNQGRAYGFANPTLTLRYDGFVNGDTPAALTGRPTVSTTATASSNAGTYPITVARNTLNSPNYDFTLVNGTLTVTPTPLTITAVDKTRAYGAANPALTVRYSGFRQGDNAGDLNGALTLTTPATTASPAGTHPIAVGQGTLASPNYTFLFANGTLTITPANTVLSAVSGAATYGGTATLTATLRQSNGTSQPIGGASVAFTIGGTAVGSAITDSSGVATLANVALGGRGAGNYSGLIRASFAGNASQAGDTATGTLRVAKAALVLRATNQSRRVGQDNPSCQIQLAPGSTFVNNDTLASLDLSNLACNYDGANRRAPAGTYTITPRGVRSDNYAITYQTGTLTVAP